MGTHLSSSVLFLFRRALAAREPLPTLGPGERGALTRLHDQLDRFLAAGLRVAEAEDRRHHGGLDLPDVWASDRLQREVAVADDAVVEVRGECVVELFVLFLWWVA